MPLRPCLDCGKLTPNSRCPDDEQVRQRAKDAKRGTAHQRGLGAAHRAERQSLISEVGPIASCPRCGRPITPQNPITGEHGVARAHGGTEITGLICRSCNSSLGARIRRQS